MDTVRKAQQYRQTNIKAFQKQRHLVFLMILLLVASLLWQQTREIHISRTPDPTGNYIAIVSYKRWQKPLSTTPGNSASHSGYLRIETTEGLNLGKADLPILWMADDIRWSEHGAVLVGSGIWDFKNHTFEPWE